MPRYHSAHSIFCITPPHMLREIVLNGSSEQRELALRSITISEQVRGQRGAMTKDFISLMKPVATEIKQRIVYDAENGNQLPGKVARQEGEPPAGQHRQGDGILRVDPGQVEAGRDGEGIVDRVPAGLQLGLGR